jgi:hypothetical protein
MYGWKILNSFSVFLLFYASVSLSTISLILISKIRYLYLLVLQTTVIILIKFYNQTLIFLFHIGNDPTTIKKENLKRKKEKNVTQILHRTRY